MARPMGTARSTALAVAILGVAFVGGAASATFAEGGRSDSMPIDASSEGVADGAADGLTESVAREATLPVSLDDRGAYEVALATNGDTLAAAWYDTRDGYAQIFVRLVGGAGAPSAEMQLTRGKRYAYEPSLQLTPDRLLVAWYDKAPGEPEMTVRLGAWTLDGQPLWQKRLSATGAHGRNPVIRLVGDEIFCAWLEASRPKQSPSVWVAWLDLEGRSVVAPRRAAPASRDTWNLNAAIDDDGRAWVAFDARLGTKRSELYLLRADAISTAVTRISDDDGAASVYPDLAFDGSQLALTWFDYRDGNSEVYLLAGPRDSLLKGPSVDAGARRVTETRGNSIGAYLAWNGGRGGLAWCDDTEGRYEVFFQPFGRDGAALSPAHRVSSSTERSLIPAIVPWYGGFALAWNEYRPAQRAPATAARSAVVFANVAPAQDADCGDRDSSQRALGDRCRDLDAEEAGACL